jgi:hypothetical protein
VTARDPLFATNRDAAAATLIHLKDKFYEASQRSGCAARAGHLNRDLVQAVIDAGAAVDKAGTDFRRRFYPKAGRVVCANGEVFTVSPAGRSTRLVYRRGGQA